MAFAVVFAMSLAVAAVLLPVGRNVDVVVPAVLHEIDTVATGVVLMAVLAPVLRVTRRDSQVERRFHVVDRVDDYRAPGNQRRGAEAAHVDSAVEARGANRDGNNHPPRGPARHPRGP